MRIALARVNYSQIYGVYDDGKAYERRDILIPYHLLVLANAVRREDIDVKIFDGEVGLLTNHELADRVIEWEPDFLGMTATTPDINATVTVCELVKVFDPDIVTIIGGPHVTAIGLDSPHVDHVVRGRGEVALCDIVAGPGYQVPLDAPAYDLLNYEQYPFTDPTRGQVRTASIMSSQGCPFDCAFCFHDKELRNKAVQDFISETRYLYETHGVRYFFIYDETFLLGKKRTIEILERLREFKDAHFHCQTRVGMVTNDLAATMRESGIVCVTMGIESGSQQMLDGISKGTSKEDGYKSCMILRDADIETKSCFIFGLPYETHETVHETIDFAKNADLCIANFNIMTPYPGTVVYDMTVRGDGLRFDKESYRTDWAAYRRHGNSIVRTDDLTSEDLKEYQVSATVDFYARRRILDHYTSLFKNGNRARFAYRPLNYAWKKRFDCNIPFWNELEESDILDPTGEIV